MALHLREIEKTDVVSSIFGRGATFDKKRKQEGKQKTDKNIQKENKEK